MYFLFLNLLFYFFVCFVVFILALFYTEKEGVGLDGWGGSGRRWGEETMIKIYSMNFQFKHTQRKKQF